MKYTTETFIEKANKVHNGKYRYSKVNYTGIHNKICIGCSIHGIFYQLPSNHIKGSGCPKCKNTKPIKYTTEEWIELAKEVHSDRYDYSKAEYKGKEEKVCIICKEHGEFYMRAFAHVRLKSGCPKCSKRHRYSTEEWIDLANMTHVGKYDYSKVEYKNAKTKVEIICPEHGSFLQTPEKHQRGEGCPKCNSSKLENAIRNFLINNKIEFIEQHSFDWLKNGKSVLKLDFYLPNYSIAIECQGIQHFQQVWFGSNKKRKSNTLSATIKRDQLKKKKCEENGIRVLYFTDVILDEYPYSVITDLNELINEIKK